MATKAGAHILEQGDIFFFYRPRVGAEEVRGREDVQRFYMVLAPEQPKKVYRLFVVGSKRLPEAPRGTRHPRGRNWALNVLTSKHPEDIRRELGAVEYSTETRGERVVGAATPVGEGKYQLLKHKNHTELAYALELPKEPGPAQKEFEIKEEAGYVIAVKNPEIMTPGLRRRRRLPHTPSTSKPGSGRGGGSTSRIQRSSTTRTRRSCSSAPMPKTSRRRSASRSRPRTRSSARPRSAGSSASTVSASA